MGILSLYNTKTTHKRIVLLSIVTFLVILYFFRLGAVPHGLHIDEAGAIYDALNLSKYGYDRYLIKNPVYFWNFGGGQNALMTYIETIWLTILPFNPINLSNVELGLFFLRLPALLVNLIGYFFLYKTFRLNYDTDTSLFGIIIALILPFSIMHSRWILESYLLFPMFIISVYSLIKAINKCSLFLYFLSGILFGLTLYTYAISYIIVVVFLFVMLIYLIYLRKVNIYEVIAFVMPLIFLGLPLLTLLLMNSGFIQIDRIDYFGFTIAKLPWFRVGEISLSNIIKNLTDINYYTTFLNDNLGYNSYKVFSTIYYINIPILLYGLIRSISRISFKNKILNVDFIIFTIFISTVFVSLLICDNNINKINLLFYPIIYYIFIGYTNLAKSSHKAFIVFIVILSISFSLFSVKYYRDDSEEKMLFKHDIIEAIRTIQYLDPEGEKTIHVDDEVSSYIYLLLYNNINPKECKKESLDGYYYNIITPTNIISTYTDTEYIEPDSFYIVYNDRDYDIYSELFEKIKEYIEIGSITIFIS